MRRLAATLVRAPFKGSSYRRWGFLLAGAALFVPYVLIYWSVGATALRGGVVGAVGIVLGIGWSTMSTAVAFIPPVRLLERTAAQALLDVKLPAETAAGARSWRSRRRTAVWYLLHLVLGAVAGAALTFALPLTVQFMSDGVWQALAGLAAIPVVFGAGVALGALMGQCAPALLGPSQADRMTQLEHQQEQLIERNRLARELHDSVGHALTVTTLQAGAARRLLDDDREFARRALAAIEDAGRAALGDLDHVLGLLRDEPGDGDKAPQRTLTDLDPLLDKTRDAGVNVLAEVTGTPDRVPPVVSREAYRIIQEGLTNALKHAGPVPVTVRLAITADRLDLEMLNPIRSPAPAKPKDRSGRGLRGMRERVTILGGEMNAGGDAEEWRIAVRLPLRWAS